MKPLRYLVYPPHGDDPAPHPLIIFLHGSGERGNRIALVKKWGLPKLAEAGEIALPAYIIAPQCPADVWWDAVIDRLEVTLNAVMRKYPIDPARVYLTGFSMGGFGTCHWGPRRPDLFAALMPVGGSGFDFESDLTGFSLSTLKTLPMWVIHSAKDEAVPVTRADHFVQGLQAVGANYGYTRYPDASHGESCDRAFRDMTILNWLLAQKREAS